MIKTKSRHVLKLLLSRCVRLQHAWRDRSARRCSSAGVRVLGVGSRIEVMWPARESLLSCGFLLVLCLVFRVEDAAVYLGFRTWLVHWEDVGCSEFGALETM